MKSAALLLGPTLILLAACSSAPSKAPSPKAAPPATAHSTPAAKPPQSLVLSPAGGGTLPLSLAGSAVAACGQSALVLGGLHAGKSTPTLLAVSAKGRVQKLPGLPFATHDAAAVCIGKTAYLFGGGIGTRPRATLASLTPSKGGWAFKKLGALNPPLSDLTAVAAGGDAYLVGGYDGKTFSQTVLRFHPGQSRPTPFARLPVGLRYAAAAATKDALYVFGGLSPKGRTRTIYRVSLGSAKVTVVGRLPHALQYAGAASLGGSIWVVGGLTAQGHFLKTVYRFDPQTGKLTLALTLKSPFAYGGTAAVGGSLLLIGGTRPGGAVAAVRILHGGPAAQGGSG